jgi:hypothetical protein
MLNARVGSLIIFGIKDRIDRIRREWFAFEPGGPPEEAILPQTNRRYSVRFEDTLKIPVEFLVYVIQDPVF